MPAGKAFGTVQTMLKMPDDSIPKLQTEFGEHWIKDDIEREYLTLLHMISDLPAN
jgi:hypothetical protein